jgi:hypothetical protein
MAGFHGPLVYFTGKKQPQISQITRIQNLRNPRNLWLPFWGLYYNGANNCWGRDGVSMKQQCHVAMVYLSWLAYLGTVAALALTRHYLLAGA